MNCLYPYHVLTIGCTKNISLHCSPDKEGKELGAHYMTITYTLSSTCGRYIWIYCKLWKKQRVVYRNYFRSDLLRFSIRILIRFIYSIYISLRTTVQGNRLQGFNSARMICKDSNFKIYYNCPIRNRICYTIKVP